MNRDNLNKKIKELVNLATTVNLQTHCRDKFLRLGKAILKEIAEELGLKKDDFNLRTNKLDCSCGEVTLTLEEVREKFGVESDCVRKYKDHYRFHRSYYRGGTATTDNLVARVKELFPTAVIINIGNHFHSFVGSAKSGSAKDSYLWVTFKVN